ncbi:MAG: folate-binding protein [Burkholderiales bacterium]|nr:folate-binding protein [Burkholderiales bacterium]
MSERWRSELARQGAQFSDGRVVSFAGNADSDFAALRDGTVLCDLSHLGLMLASGEEAAAFLHGQFCNDILALSEGNAQWNGWCSPKGRLLVTLLAWSGKQGLFLMLPRSLQPAIQKRLQMFVLRAKVKLADESDTWVRFGVAGPNAESLLRDAAGTVPESAMSSVHIEAGRIIKLAVNRYVVIASPDNAVLLWNQLAVKAVPVGALVWDWLSIHEGIITVLPETQDAFVPQMANFELIGGVSFKKGCYPGQEIVARTQYRGILKRRMVLTHIDITTSPVPGEKLFSSAFGDQAAGEVANVAPAPDGGFDMLVVAQTGAIDDNDLKYAAVDGAAVSIKSLPYTVPLAPTS